MKFPSYKIKQTRSKWKFYISTILKVGESHNRIEKKTYPLTLTKIEKEEDREIRQNTSLWLWVMFSKSVFPLVGPFFLATTQSAWAATSAENPIPGPHQTSWESTQPTEPEFEPSKTPWPFTLFFAPLLRCFSFLALVCCQSADVRMRAGSDTCREAPAVHPNPLKVTAEKLVFFLLVLRLGRAVSPQASWEEAERIEEMVDLQRVEWGREGICGSGLVWEMRCENWVLGLVHLECWDSEASAASGMV